jgi:uncharacterized protein YegL
MLDIVFILDESTSMADHIDEYINGVNTLLNTQKQQNPMANLTIVKFSSNVNVLCVDSKMCTLPEFTTEHYRPDGVTALYDAIGYAITLKHDRNINSMDTVNNVIVIILTDGEDNHSSHDTLETIIDKIEYLKNIGWEFVFIAANQNATAMGIRMGIDTCVSYSTNKESIAQVAEACNVAIGHAVQKWTGVANMYSNQEMPFDLKDIMEGFGNCRI